MSSSPEVNGGGTSKRSKRPNRKTGRTPEQPDFLSDFPKDADLAPAVNAFAKGNYRETRRVCNELLERDLDPDVHAAARELLRRLVPDRLIIGILWGTFILLVLIVVWAYGQQ